jgi:hypothetical protein
VAGEPDRPPPQASSFCVRLCISAVISNVQYIPQVHNLRAPIRPGWGRRSILVAGRNYPLAMRLNTDCLWLYVMDNIGQNHKNAPCSSWPRTPRSLLAATVWGLYGVIRRGTVCVLQQMWAAVGAVMVVHQQFQPCHGAQCGKARFLDLRPLNR